MSSRKLFQFAALLSIVFIVYMLAETRAHSQSASYPFTIPVQYAPDPDNGWNFVQDGKAAPYVVPQGYDLCITDLSCDTMTGGYGQLKINHKSVYWFSGTSTAPTFDPGFCANQGDAVDIEVNTAPGSTACASGYLVSRNSYPKSLRVPYTPLPESAVNLDSVFGPSSYTVPANKILVMRTLNCPVWVNGKLTGFAGNAPASGRRLSSGLVAQAGDFVTCTGHVQGFLKGK